MRNRLKKLDWKGYWQGFNNTFPFSWSVRGFVSFFGFLKIHRTLSEIMSTKIPRNGCSNGMPTPRNQCHYLVKQEELFEDAGLEQPWESVWFTHNDHHHNRIRQPCGTWDTPDGHGWISAVPYTRSICIVEVQHSWVLLPQYLCHSWSWRDRSAWPIKISTQLIRWGRPRIFLLNKKTSNKTTTTNPTQKFFSWCSSPNIATQQKTIASYPSSGF